MILQTQKLWPGIGLLLCLGFVAGCAEEQQTSEAEPRPIAWIKTEASDSSQVRRISGVLQAAESADLSFEVGGKVQSVAVNLGDQVKQGDVLAELDESSYELSLKASEGQLQEAQAVYVEAENEFKRQADLHRKGWVSKAGFDNAKAALDTAQSAVDIAKAQLALTKKDLVDTALRAPYDGNITARLVEPSQQVVAGQTIFQIEGRQGLEVSVMVPETIIGNLEQDQVYKTHFPALPEVTLDAEITEIGSQAEAANAFPVTLFLQGSGSTLRAGMSAEVDFTFEGAGRTGHRGQTVRVPPTALLAGEDQNAYVFVFDESAGVVRKRKVQTENVFNNEVLISDGLSPGEIIAVAGVVYLTDGQAVSLMNVGDKKFN